MLDNELTLNDGTADHVYDLVSRSGMNSMRREDSVDSELASALIINNTVDLNSLANNRHLVQFKLNEKDATTGELYSCVVHMVINRHKKFSDAGVLNLCARLKAYLTDVTLVTDNLVGGN